MSAEPITSHDLDPERMLLGAVLRDPATLPAIEAQVRVEQFTRPEHRAIYAALLSMAQASRPIDTVTLRDELQTGGDLESAGGVLYLAGLTDGLPRLSSVEAWARIVTERWKRRAVVSIARRLLEHADGSDLSTDELVDKGLSWLGKLSESGDQRVVKLRDVLPRAVKDLEEFVSAKEGVTGIPTGLLDLDRCLSGLQPGRLYVVAARTSRGKSVLCAQTAVNAALHGFRAFVFSMEMEPYQLAQRMVLADAEVDRWDLKPESPKAEYSWGKVTRAVGRLEALPVWFDQRESPNLAQIRASARQQAQGPGVDLIVVDYLQRCAVDAKQDRWLAVGDIAKGLKSLAMSLRVPVVAACQLTADAEEKRPTLASLAQAQSIISAEADAIVLLHPDDLQRWKMQEYPMVHCYVDKNRTGPCQDIQVSFEKACSRFVSLARVGN